MADAPQVVTHNFRTLNRHVDEIFQRNRVLTQRRRARVFTTYAKYGSLFVIAVAVAVAIVILALGVLFSPEPRIIERQVVVERPVTFEPRIILPPMGAEQRVRAEAGERLRVLRDKPVPGGTADSPPASPVFNYVIFKELPFEREGLETVTIGMRYEDNNAELPSEQWCYVARELDDGTARRLDLAFKTGDRIDMVSIDARTSSSMEVSETTLKSAQEMCAFQ